MAMFDSLSENDTSTDTQQDNNQLYCSYSYYQCKTPAKLLTHCKQNSHKHKVFADSERDVFWQFEPPPPEKEEISEALHG